MKNFITLILVIACSVNSLQAQCFAPTSLSSSNVNYYNAHVNWAPALNAHHYKVRYKEINSNIWLYKYNIDAAINTKLLNGLSPLSEYIWQITTHCDSTNTLVSSWSVLDTFFTFNINCPNTTNLLTTNVNYNNALASWDTVNGANRYKVHYRKLGDTTWSNLSFVYHPNNSTTIPLLQQNTTYEWQVMTYHDSTNLATSLWSISDTFTTLTFIPAPFNPLVSNTLSNVQCNMPTELNLIITQAANEPDIGTSEITSDGGYFDLGLFSTGDSVGYAIMTTSNQTIESTLRYGINLGSLAIINSYDTSGTLIGFFTIENTSVGIKVSSTSPNDGNNYTSGYTSIINFTNLFVNPINACMLRFFIDIESELCDQVQQTDSTEIFCNTNTINLNNKQKKIVEIYDINGKNTQLNSNKISLIRFSDGTTRKAIYIERR